MPYRKPIIYITSSELCTLLNITPEELLEIENKIDNASNKEWELKKDNDYEIVVKSTGLRKYRDSGAYCIARYLENQLLEKNKHKNFWTRIFEEIKKWFIRTKEKIDQACVKTRILNNCSSLMKRRDNFFISQIDVVRIFETKLDYLQRIHEECQKISDDTPTTLIKGKDYDEFIDEGGFYYSLSGIQKLSLAFHQSLTPKNRKQWCKDVGLVVEEQVDDIIQRIKKRDKNIPLVMNRVRDKRDKKTCQVTHQKQVPASSFKLAVHHLYSKNQYPHLADSESNLITLTIEVHDQFHDHFMRGKNKPCTIDHFIDFVKNYYPENSEIVIWLQEQKLKLGDQKPLGKKKPHVLHLPGSQFK